MQKGLEQFSLQQSEKMLSDDPRIGLSELPLRHGPRHEGGNQILAALHAALVDQPPQFGTPRLRNRQMPLRANAR